MAEEDRELREGLLSVRYYLYTLLARAFDRAPDEEFLSSLTGETVCECLQTLALGYGGALWRDAGFLCSLRDMDGADLLARSQQEFERLFSGPGEPPVPRRASAYRGGKGGAARLRRPLEAAGLDPRAPEGYVSYRLDAMAGLCGGALAAMEERRPGEARRLLSRQKAFLEKRLLTWVPAFAERAAGMPGGVLYPQLGGILGDFLQTERARLHGGGEAAGGGPSP